MLRIRPDNATIRELKIPKENLEELQKIVSSNAGDELKKLMIKRLANASPCCTCGGIPSLEVIYQLEGASRIERYCEQCASRVFSRNAVL